MMYRSRLLYTSCVLGLTVFAGTVHAGAVVIQQFRSVSANADVLGSVISDYFSINDVNSGVFESSAGALNSDTVIYNYCNPPIPECDIVEAISATANATQSSYLNLNTGIFDAALTASLSASADVIDSSYLPGSAVADASTGVDVTFLIDQSYSYSLTLNLIGDAAFVLEGSTLAFDSPGSYSVNGVLSPGLYILHTFATATTNPFLFILAATSDTPTISAFAPGTQSGVGFNFGLSAVPIPPAIWLFGSGLMGFVGIARRKISA